MSHIPYDRAALCLDCETVYHQHNGDPCPACGGATYHLIQQWTDGGPVRDATDRMTAAEYQRQRKAGTLGTEAAGPPGGRKYPEWELQKATAELVRTLVRDDVVAFHVPNERESSVQRRLLAAGGVLPGVADWVFFALVRDLVPRPFCIELKAPGRKDQLSGAQRDFEARCVDIGVPYRVVDSLDGFLETLDDWELLKPGVVAE